MAITLWKLKLWHSIFVFFGGQDSSIDVYDLGIQVRIGL